MMAGSRGEAPSPFDTMLALVTDQKATAERIKQLKAAQEEHDAAYAKLKTREAELDAEASELDGKAALLAKHEDDLDGRENAVRQGEASLEGKNRLLREQIDKLNEDRDEFAAEQKQAKAEASTLAAADAERGQAITTREDEIERIQRDLMRRSDELDAREADLAQRIADHEAAVAKIRESLAGVGV